jgi:fatty-acyl-CoA synthase
MLAAEVREYWNGKIAHFKIPQHVRVVESLPMTVSGKVQKFRIRELETEALGLSNQITTSA